MKKSYKDLFMVVAYIAGNIYNEETKGQKKLGIIRKKLQSYLDAYNEERDALRLENASCDDKNNVIIDEKGEYSYSKDALAKFSKQVKELSDKEFDYQAIVINNPLELDQYIFLNGWVIGVDFKIEEEIEL
jgi:uncharacterized protein with WD repeat